MTTEKNKLREFKNSLLEIILTIFALTVGLFALAGILRLITSIVGAFIADDWFLLGVSLLGFSTAVMVLLVFIGLAVDYIEKCKRL